MKSLNCNGFVFVLMQINYAEDISFLSLSFYHQIAVTEKKYRQQLADLNAKKSSVVVEVAKT